MQLVVKCWPGEGSLREGAFAGGRRGRRRSCGPILAGDAALSPDRLVGGAPILEQMARDGVYRSQFETGVSNGGLTAYPGGDRWRWESRIFAGAYDDGPPASRPKYGALNFRKRRVGGSPRFGSAHFRLTAEALARTTFCYPDSYSHRSPVTACSTRASSATRPAPAVTTSRH
jgi:hypothetical protein